MEDLCGGDFIDDFDIIGASQLGGTPLQPSQDVPTQTPVAGSRPQRTAGSPDRFTYFAGHVYAHQRGRGPVLVGVVRCVPIYEFRHSCGCRMSNGHLIWHDSVLCYF